MSRRGTSASDTSSGSWPTRRRPSGHYRHAIHQFERLAADRPAEPQYRRSLADTYNWLGETLRPFAARAGDAKSAYDDAIALQQQLLNERRGERRCSSRSRTDTLQPRHPAVGLRVAAGGRGIRGGGSGVSPRYRAARANRQQRREPHRNAGPRPCAEQPRIAAGVRSPASRGRPTPLRARHPAVRGTLGGRARQSRVRARALQARREPCRFIAPSR